MQENTIRYRYSYKEVRNRLTEYKLKATQQRIVIYEALLNMENHPTAEMIYEHIRPNNPSISLGTIYKTLDTFVSVELATKVMSDQGQLRYDANMGAHNHIYCTNTKEIMDYEDEELKHIIEAYFKKKNISNLLIKDIKLHIHGEKINPDEKVSIN